MMMASRQFSAVRATLLVFGEVVHGDAPPRRTTRAWRCRRRMQNRRALLAIIPRGSGAIASRAVDTVAFLQR